MITYGGVALEIPRDTFRAELASNFSLAELVEFQSPEWTGLPGGWKHPDFKGQRNVRLGRLSWPRGASKWAVGHFLVHASKLEIIRRAAYTGTNNSAGVLPLPLVLADSNDDADLKKITTDLYMLPPRPLLQWDTLEQPDPGAMYLLTLVDARFWWWSKGAEIAITERTTTWEQLYAAIGTALGVTITVDAIPASYQYPPVDLQCRYDYLPLLLDAVAFSVGQRIVRQLDGTVHAVNASNAWTTQNELWAFASGCWHSGGDFNFDRTQPNQDLPPLVPAQVRVAFPIHIQDPASPDSLEEVIVTKHLVELGLSQFTGISAKLDAKVIRSTAVAWLDNPGDTTAANNTELSNLATRIAKDWYQWQLGYTSRVFTSILEWDGDAFADYVEWEAFPESKTTVCRETMNGLETITYHASRYGAISSADGFEIRRFKLTEALYECSSAEAYVVMFRDGRWEVTPWTMTVYAGPVASNHICPDPASSSSSSSSSSSGTGTSTAIADQDTFGFARYFPDSDRWEIIDTGALSEGEKADIAGFFAHITQRGYAAGLYTYGFEGETDNGDGTFSVSLTLPSAILSATISMTSGGTNIQNISIQNATSGNWTFTGDGGTTSALAYNASAGTVQSAINAILTGGHTCTVTGSGTLASPWHVVFSASISSPSVASATLIPAGSTGIAREFQNRKIAIGTYVWMHHGIESSYWFSCICTTVVTVLTDASLNCDTKTLDKTYGDIYVELR